MNFSNNYRAIRQQLGKLESPFKKKEETKPEIPIEDILSKIQKELQELRAGQIDLQNDIEDLKKEDFDIEGALDNLHSEIANIQSSVEDLESPDMDHLEYKLDDLQRDVAGTKDAMEDLTEVGNKVQRLINILFQAFNNKFSRSA